MFKSFKLNYVSNQSISETKETNQLIKHERKSISSDPNNEQRIKQSIVAMGIKEEPIDSEIQTSHRSKSRRRRKILDNRRIHQ